jgi:hypothetical protein
MLLAMIRPLQLVPKPMLTTWAIWKTLQIAIWP